MRGHAYLAMKGVDSAIADSTESIRLSPALAPLYTNRADAYLAKGDFTRANADLRKAAELDGKPDS
jgi:tetratricopeptide (TPR) repeat protein